jgi:hypothetical protein
VVGAHREALLARAGYFVMSCEFLHYLHLAYIPYWHLYWVFF